MSKNLAEEIRKDLEAQRELFNSKRDYVPVIGGTIDPNVHHHSAVLIRDQIEDAQRHVVRILIRAKAAGMMAEVSTPVATDRDFLEVWRDVATAMYDGKWHDRIPAPPVNVKPTDAVKLIDHAIAVVNALIDAIGTPKPTRGAKQVAPAIVTLAGTHTATVSIQRHDPVRPSSDYVVTLPMAQQLPAALTWVDPTIGTAYTFKTDHQYQVWLTFADSRCPVNLLDVVDRVAKWKDSSADAGTVTSFLKTLREWWRDQGRPDIANRIVTTMTTVQLAPPN